MLLLMCVVSMILFQDSSEQSTPIAACPAWTYPNPQAPNECVCGNSLHNTIICEQDTLTSFLTVSNICVFFSEELQTTLAGTCPYGYGQNLPTNLSKPKEKSTQFCFHWHRAGQLCGGCEENYTLPAYSYYIGCVKCESYKNGWIKFIAAAFLPLTLFYIIIILFRISATSPALNAFVMVNQVLAIPPVVRQFYSSNLTTDPWHISYFGQFSTGFIIAVLSIWNLDFFRSFHHDICLYPNLNYQHTLLLEYIIGVYPLFLIFFTYIMVKLHDNFATIVCLWRPFHRCLAVLRRQWDIKSYLVHALATFIVLSYIKILNTSFEFLVPSHVFNMMGQRVNKAYWYYDGSVDMLSRDYLPYLILALFMLFTFNILPLLLLALYPLKRFQRVLDCLLPTRFKLPLHIYMDTFHGCYESSTHDYRHFASLYMAIRFFNLLIISAFDLKLYVPAASLLFAFTIALVAKFQPYKDKRSNTVDIVMLLAMVFGYTSSTMHSLEYTLYPKWLNGLVVGAAILIIYSYLLHLILVRVLMKVNLYLARNNPFSKLKRKFCKVMIKHSSGEVDVESQANIVDHEDTDNYGSCQ